MQEHRTIAYAILSLREVSRITTGAFSDLIKECGPKPASGVMDDSEWSALSSLFMKILRDAFHAFSLGDWELAQRAIYGEEAFEKSTIELRSKLLKKGLGNASKLMDLVTVEGRLAHAALDMAREDLIL